MDNILSFIFLLHLICNGKFVSSRTIDAVASSLSFNEQENADEKTEFPDGDIVRGDKVNLWPDGIVYFSFVDDSISNVDKKIIWSAMEEFHLHTCIRFEESETRVDKLYILTEGEKCYAHVGKNGDRPFAVLGRNCMSKGVIIHQLMHVLGFAHENTRKDRDGFITVKEENIREGYSKLFDISDEDLTVPYDYLSITHFSSFAYAKADGLKTIIPRQGKKIGQRISLSAKDVAKIFARYKCTLHCQEDGLFPHPYDCNKFISCSGFIVHEMNCPGLTYFHPSINKCEWGKPETGPCLKLIQ